MSSLAKGDWKAADAAFTESLRLDPGLTAAMVGEASVAAEKGDTKQAESYFRQALAKSPDDPSIHRSWSRFLISQKRYPEAESALKKAIALQPKQAAIPDVELGDLYLMGMHKPNEALREYRAALVLDPISGKAHYGAGSAYAANREYTLADAEFTLAERLLPGDPMPIQAIAVVQMLQKKYQPAAENFTRALAIRPDQIPWLIGRGEAYEALGNPNRALKDYESCVRIDHNYSTGYLKIGVIYQSQNRFAEAMKAYESAIAADPKQPFAYNNLAFGLAEKKERLDDALKFANKAVELAPEIPQYQDTLAWVRRARGELDPAARILEKITTSNAPADFYYHLGIVYSEQGRKADAGAALKKALATGKLANAADAQQRLAQLASR